jgi:predicted ABC-type transport system involved in lysophospholipase L1 biosynthesis ATPase subunit
VPTLTALENVLLACEYAGIKGKTARDAALEALGLVGLADRAGHKPSELSGGESSLCSASSTASTARRSCS